MFPRFNLPKIRKVIFTIVALVAVFGTGYFLGIKGFQAQIKKGPTVKIERVTPPEKNIDFSLFWRVWDTLASKYFDKTRLIPAEMVYGAIQGMVSSLGDPYTVFLKPSENKIVNEDLNGSFEGVGIQIGFRGARLAVISPLPGSPAEKAGIKARDFIIEIKDEGRQIERNTSGITLPEAVGLIRGRAGTKVSLTIVREGEEEPKVFEITRAKLEVPSIILEFMGDGGKIAHVKLVKFSGETAKEWEKVVAKISANSQVTGIIIDLRNNPGGYLQAAVDVASDFLKGGQVVVVEEKGDKTRNEFKVERIARLQSLQVLVLVNEGSASASEILAGALRDQKKVKLIGETTFGKGTIQEPIEIEGGSGLHITTARWLTPSGFWVNEKGLEPDVKIEDNEETNEDEQLQEAIRLLQ